MRSGASTARALVERYLLDRYEPPHAVIDGGGDVVHISAGAEEFFDAPPGAPVRQLAAIARKELRLDLTMLFRRAVATGREAARNGIEIETQAADMRRVGLRIEPISTTQSSGQLYLVLFLDDARNEAIERADDLHRLVEGTDVATVLLDRSLLIRSFTPAAGRLLAIRAADRGRPITDLSDRFDLSGLVGDAGRVVDEQTVIERRSGNEDGSQTWLIRLAPDRDGKRAVQGVTVTFTDITSLVRAEKHLRVLTAELQHRTRNLLAVVQSLAGRSFDKGPALDAFLTRLAALGRVQGLISKADGERIDLREVVTIEVEALGTIAVGKVEVNGESVGLPREHVQILGLALHELATNAARHGALRETAGRLEIGWAVQTDAQGGQAVALSWRESGLATPPDPTRRGFGRHLIEHALSHTSKAGTELSFHPDGVLCRFVIPLGRD